jgi:hypothetical protein
VHRNQVNQVNQINHGSDKGRADRVRILLPIETAYHKAKKYKRAAQQFTTLLRRPDKNIASFIN